MRHVLLACASFLCLLLASPSGPCAPAQPAGGAAPVGAAMTDCNGNGIEDAVDIALGDSADRDFDGVPDECQGARPGPGEEQ